MAKQNKIDKYLFRDNVSRLCLYDMLRRKSYLQTLTLKELDNLVRSVNTLLFNLQSDFESGKMMINVSDEHNWSESTLFRNIFLHNVLDVKIICGGTTKDFKNKLTKRWEKK